MASFALFSFTGELAARNRLFVPMCYTGALPQRATAAAKRAFV
jgi:hypothetical protein